ncbi:MAG: nicotinate-nucleotide adenylyltransferase [Candidatus Alcyoniella australis]|nr:nicotinate-nucleotide adenylyltransferase [Candidatus Alcyoniella australis]
MRLGVFGGTFDPLHIAHLICARHVANAAHLDRLLLIPSNVPPHKHSRTASPGALRMEMIERSIVDDPLLEACNVEIDRQPPSYSLDTVQQLAKRYPQADLFFIIGADAFSEINTWHRWQELIQSIDFLLLGRPGSEFESPEKAVPALARQYAPLPGEPAAWRHVSGRTVRRIDAPLLQISSSEVRRRVAAGEPIRYMVPDPVLQIVQREGLYR